MTGGAPTPDRQTHEAAIDANIVTPIVMVLSINNKNSFSSIASLERKPHPSNHPYPPTATNSVRIHKLQTSVGTHQRARAQLAYLSQKGMREGGFSRIGHKGVEGWKASDRQTAKTHSCRFFSTVASTPADRIVQEQARTDFRRAN